ncbi:hypothetical protein [Sphingobacterium bovistauri]|uniref:Uncharacterized protein n=1 Tax=Sphingobacterium bovistauri TaxID=2781959 RepID=A0ABS7Z2N4_9SPHI|nr:hypothetical protein [Sphingobacterium bovistauri]MCA5004366.1 hypothetical protein [Sphingobacterium bovistauri]
MKPVIILAVLLIWSTSHLCAQTKTFNQVENQLNAQKKKKKTANTLLIAGGAGILLGTLLAVTPPSDNAMKSTGALVGGIAFISAGSITSLISIPFYIDTYYDKKKMGQLQPTFSYTQAPFHKFPQVGMRLTF